MPTPVRIALEQFNVLDGSNRNHVLGALLVGTPSDDLVSLVRSGKRILLETTDQAELQMRVHFRSAASSDEERLAALRRMLHGRAMVLVRAWLASGGGDDLPDRVVLSADDVTAFGGWPRKICSFQRQTAPGLVCDATSSGPPKTSVPLCEECSLPDDRVRCTALSHPSIASEPYVGGLSKSPAGALCDGGHDELVDDFSSCRVGGHTCWRQDVPLVAAGGAEAPSDSPDRLLDEFGHLRKALAGIGITVPRASGELQLGATITRPCTGPEEFLVRIQALASLLELVSGQTYARDHGIVLDDATRGKLASLSRVLTHLGATGHESAISLLRVVPALRNQAPVHAMFDDAALRIAQFGIEQPIADWPRAWLIVSDRVRGALREVRLAMETRDVDAARANQAAIAAAASGPTA